MTDNRILRHAGLTVWASIVLFCSPGFGRAQSLSDILAPCLDEHTFAVVRLDLAAIDIDAAFDFVADVLPEPEARQDVAATLDQQKQQLQDDLRLPQLLSAGVNTAYLVLSTDDLPNVIVAAPMDAQSDEAQIADWIDRVQWQTLRKGNLILAAPKPVLARWKDKPPLRRPDLDRAAASAKPGTVQAFVAPNADTRRVLEALLASWPEPRLSVPNGAIANGLQWGTLTVAWPPQLSLDLRIEATGPAAAETLRGTLRGILTAVSQLPSASATIPNLAQALESLRPEVEGSTVRLTMGTEQLTRLVADLLTPQMIQTREQAKQVSCSTRLRQLAVSVHMYTQDHDNKLPPNLQAIADAGMLSVELFSCEGRPYVYRAVDLPNLDVTPMMILAHGSAGAHRGGRNVVFVDGHVEWTSEGHFVELIERDNQLRRERGLPEKPAE